MRDHGVCAAAEDLAEQAIGRHFLECFHHQLFSIGREHQHREIENQFC